MQSVVDFNEPEQLSVVLHGGIVADNAVEIARNCVHWRSLFPRASLILSISSSNLLDLEGSSSESGLALAPNFKNESILRSAIQIMNGVCDKIVFARPTLPLPTIKGDNPKLNNGNLLIAGAQAGLAAARSRYVLRVRSDFVFYDAGFLDRYFQYLDAEVGKRRFLQQRVLVADLFTLNPYTFERMPFHVSDWFHFGLTEDVTALWAVPDITLADAIYYKTHPHVAGSLLSERLVNVRLAVEQHLMFNAVSQFFPDLKLDYHNDLASIADWMEVLLDNFIICDTRREKVMLPKYDFEIRNHARDLLCLTHDDWVRLATSRHINPELVLGEKIGAVRSPERYNVKLPFPRLYSADRLGTKIGRLVNGELVAMAPNGTFSFGPSGEFPRGTFNARLLVTTLEGSGHIQLSVTTNLGKRTLTQRRIFMQGDTPQALEVPFEIEEAIAFDVECVCVIEGIREIAIAGIVFESLDVDRFDLVATTIWPGMLQLANADTQRGEIHNTLSTGLLFCGPYMSIRPGLHRLTFNVAEAMGRGSCRVLATLDKGKVLLAEHSFVASLLRIRPITFDFVVPGPEMGRNFEVACHLDDVEQFVVRSIIIQPLADEEKPATMKTPMLRDLQDRG